MKKVKVIALAAGGTGGHVFPALALAEAAIDNGLKPLLVCDQRTNEFLKGDFAKMEFLKIFAPKPKDGTWIGAIFSIFQIIPTIFFVRRYLKDHNVDCVVGFGGYPSFPTLIAAKMLGIKTFLHEQNAVLGRVNRIMASCVDGIFLSFKHTRLIKKSWEKKTSVVGNLVRRSVKKCATHKHDFSPQAIKILVIGGSQGAKIMSDIMPKAIMKLPESIQKCLIIRQQARLNLIDETKNHYKKTKAKVEVRDFFENIGEVMCDSDLIIGRAGASSVTEIAMMGKASILIPLKIATDNHQFFNAKSLHEVGGAEIILEDELTPKNMAKVLLAMLEDHERLVSMGKNAKKAIVKNGDKKILEQLLA